MGIIYAILNVMETIASIINKIQYFIYPITTLYVEIQSFKLLNKLLNKFYRKK